jgi:hypothetical protein
MNSIESELTEAPALTPEQRTALLEAEVSYQTARAELAAAEQARYARLWSAYLAAGRDAAALLAEAPSSVTRATLAAAIRRHAEPGDWVQPVLFELES